MRYVFHEPQEYGFKDRDGHDGKFFGTHSPKTNHLIIECSKRLTISILQQESEFNYYIIEGEGYFVLNDEKQAVSKSDLVVIPPNTKYSFGGTLKMLLINTPHWNTEQEKIFRDTSS